MPSFDDLMKKTHVKNHPLLAGRKKVQQIRAAWKHYAQEMEPTEDGSPDTEDIFNDLSDEDDNVSTDDAKLSTVIYKSSAVVNDLLCQFDFPIMPSLRFLKSQGLKHASMSDDRVVGGILIFEAKFETVTGARNYLEIPVTLVKGSIIPPSVVYNDGREYVLTQSLVDRLVRRNTSYALEPFGSMFGPPLVGADRQIEVDRRNEMGYQPIENDTQYMSVKKSRRKRSRINKSRAQEVAHLAAMEIVGEHEDFGMSDFSEGTYSFYGKTSDGSFFSVYVDDDTDSNFPEATVDVDGNLEYVSYKESRKKKSRKRPTKKARSYPAPSAYKTITDLMDEAEEDQTDTFPRPWIHLLRTYLLQVFSCVSQDRWMPQLINDGYCINPYGTNRGRAKQATTADMEKEVDFEVSDEPAEVEEFNLTDITYPDTKTPIEAGDKVRFQGYDGPIRGTVVELDVNEGYIIVGTKGVEYRVNAEDVEPLNSTFRKMYM